MVLSWKHGDLQGGSIDEISNENAPHSVKLTSRRVGLAGGVDLKKGRNWGEGMNNNYIPQDPKDCSSCPWRVDCT